MTSQIITKTWSFAHVLKMADEQSKPPYNRESIVPMKFNWESLKKRDGHDLLNHCRHLLEELGTKSGMPGEIFRRAKPEVQNPAILRRLIVDLIDTEDRSRLEADVKGDIYEGMLADTLGRRHL